MRHNKIRLLSIVIIFLSLFDSCQKKNSHWNFPEKDLEEIRISPEWFVKNLNIILYEKIQNPKKYGFVALLYRAAYSKQSKKIFISFHPIWKRMNRSELFDSFSLVKLTDRVDTFLVSLSISEKNEAGFDSVLLKAGSDESFSIYPAGKFPLFSRDKFLGDSIPITIHITLDTQKEIQYPGYRDDRYSGVPVKIITNPVSDAKIVKGLSGFIFEDSDKSYYLGYFSPEVWDEYFMDSIFNPVRTFVFEKSARVPLLWP